MVAGRVSFSLFMLFSVAVVTGSGPVIDLVLFGVHEHIAPAPEHANEVTPVDSGSGHAGSHHCDLSMNPAEVAPVADLVTPTVVATVAPSVVLPDFGEAPFAPLVPPRA